MPDVITRNSVPAVQIAQLELVTERAIDREVEHVLHPQMWGSGHLVAFRPTRLRSGRIKLVFPSSTAAWDAVDLLASGHSFTWAADDPNDSMTFVVMPGPLQPRQGQSGGSAWTVELAIQEVTP